MGENLDIRDLDIDELESRLELASAVPTPTASDGWFVYVSADSA